RRRRPARDPDGARQGLHVRARRQPARPGRRPVARGRQVRRTWPIFAVFGVCLLALLGVMTWATSVVLALQRADRDARRQARLEEHVRLALWRMDSHLLALIARENARPPHAYASSGPGGASAPPGSS